jgi:hypothetical protein
MKNKLLGMIGVSAILVACQSGTKTTLPSDSEIIQKTKAQQSDAKSTLKTRWSKHYGFL